MVQYNMQCVIYTRNVYCIDNTLTEKPSEVREVQGARLNQHNTRAKHVEVVIQDRGCKPQ